MRLKEFDKEKEWRKLQKRLYWNKPIIILSSMVVILAIIYLYQSFAIYEVTDSFNIINAKVGTFVKCTNDLPSSLLNEQILYNNGGICTIELKGTPDFRYPAEFPHEGIIETITMGSGYYYGKNFTFDGTYYTLVDTMGPFASHTSQAGTYTLKETTPGATSTTLYYITAYTSSTTAQGKVYTNTPPSTFDGGMYAMEDEYGMSYYFRGRKDFTNNNVIFAEMQWKVLRINGDGSIRLIYNGKCPLNSCTINENHIDGLLTATSITENGSKYTNAWNIDYVDDAKYVGFMYGGLNGVASSNYIGATESIKGTSTSSNMKTVLETWYNGVRTQDANFSPTDKTKIVDNIFCNDRNPSTLDDALNGLGGYAKITTYYASFLRFHLSLPMTLKCQNTQGTVPPTNDQFTVNQISYNHPSLGSKTIGNGALTFPVGLVTVNEALLAGLSTRKLNFSSNYLYSNQHFWSMSPSSLYSNVANISWITGSSFGELYVMSGSEAGTRPVINLSAEVTISGGNGTALNPYIVAN